MPDKNDSFLIRKPIDEEGHVLDLQSEKNRFKLARIGDHLADDALPVQPVSL